MVEQSHYFTDEMEYWTTRTVQQQSDKRAQMLRKHIRCTQGRFWLFVAALAAVAMSSLALEAARIWVGITAFSSWRWLGGILPGLLGLVAMMGFAVAFVRDVYGMPDWRHAFGYAWLLLFGRAPLSVFDLRPSATPVAPYPFITVQHGKLDEKSENMPLARFGGPGGVIIFNDSAVFLEQSGRFTRVAGPGAVFLQQFERICETFDLRPHDRSDKVTALTKDGIQVETEVQVRFQLARPPTNLGPPTPKVPYPVYTQALIRAGKCHIHSVNVDKGTESVIRWPERASGAGGPIRALIGEHRLDELLEPHEPERYPHQEISQCLQKRLKNSARDVGAQVLEARMGTLEPTLEEVKKERITSWRADWKSRALTEEARGKAEAIRERGLARAYGQMEIILALMREFQEAVKRGKALPADFVALRFIEVLREVWTRPGGMLMPVQALRMLDDLRKTVTQDPTL